MRGNRLGLCGLRKLHRRDETPIRLLVHYDNITIMEPISYSSENNNIKGDDRGGWLAVGNIVVRSGKTVAEKIVYEVVRVLQYPHLTTVQFAHARMCVGDIIIYASSTKGELSKPYNYYINAQENRNLL